MVKNECGYSISSIATAFHNSTVFEDVLDIWDLDYDSTWKQFVILVTKRNGKKFCFRFPLNDIKQCEYLWNVQDMFARYVGYVSALTLECV